MCVLCFPPKTYTCKSSNRPNWHVQKKPIMGEWIYGIMPKQFFYFSLFSTIPGFFHYIIITIILPIIISLIIITLINIFIFITIICHYHLLLSSFINILVYFSYYSVVIIIFICFICYLFWYYVLAFYC